MTTAQVVTRDDGAAASSIEALHNETARLLKEIDRLKMPAEVVLALNILLRHLEPGWDNCRTVVEHWLDEKKFLFR